MAGDIQGVVEEVVWDFIDVLHFVYPILHFEIGLTNATLDGLYDVLDDKVERMTTKEKRARSEMILAKISKRIGTTPMELFGDLPRRTSKYIRQNNVKKLSDHEKKALISGKQDIENHIKDLGKHVVSSNVTRKRKPLQYPKRQ